MKLRRLNPIKTLSIISRMAQSFNTLHEFGSVHIANNGILRIGNDGDGLEISFDGASTTTIEGTTANDEISIGPNVATDVRFNGATAGADMVWDASNDELVFANNASFRIGDSGDGFTISFDGTDTLNIDPVNANDIINIGETTVADVIINGATAGADIQWDASADQLLVTNDASLRIGSAADGFVATFDGTDTLNIDPANANDILRIGETTLADFQVDVTSGNDLIVDASANQIALPDTTLFQTALGEPGSGSVTLTAAILLGGLVDEDPEGSVNWTTDTAALIVAAISGARVGMTFDVWLHNDATAASAEVITLVGGTGVTLHGTTLTLTEGTNVTGILRLRLTNVGSGTEAIDGYLITNA